MNKKNVGFMVLLLTLCCSSLLLAEPAQREFSEGLEYQSIHPALATQNDDGRVEVMVLFLYACPHCHSLESKLTEWAKDKSEYISLTRMPAIIGAPWADQARAYYTAEKLGILDTAHQALFKSIHQDGEQYVDDQSVMRFFVRQGVKPADFIAAYRSPEVEEKVSQSRIMTVKYGIRGVPAIIINGKYRTAQYFTGTQEKLLAIVDMLVEKERNGRNEHLLTEISQRRITK